MGVDPHRGQSRLPCKPEGIAEQFAHDPRSLAGFRHADPVQRRILPVRQPCSIDVCIGRFRRCLKHEGTQHLPVFHGHPADLPLDIPRPDRLVGIALLPLIHPQPLQLSLGILRHGTERRQVFLFCECKFHKIASLVRKIKSQSTKNASAIIRTKPAAMTTHTSLALGGPLGFQGSLPMRHAL